jgi:hypothetical protein
MVHEGAQLKGPSTYEHLKIASPGVYTLRSRRGSGQNRICEAFKNRRSVCQSTSIWLGFVLYVH